MNDTAVINRVAAWVSAISLVAIGWSLFQWANAKGVFALRQVAVVSKLSDVDTGLLESAIRSDVRGTFFTVSPHRVRANLKKLPWVREAVVERRWPLALDVRIEEYRAVGYWGDNDLLSDRGEVFRASARAPMPRFDGPVEAAPETLARYRDAKVTLAPLGLEIKAMNVSSRGALTIAMRNGLTIELGRENIDERFARFVNLYSSWTPAERETIARIDLRYKSAVAIARGQVSPASITATSTTSGAVATVGSTL
ncbi:MAG: cell division protein FtsQ/DivIB [Casimicrobium sp.]